LSTPAYTSPPNVLRHLILALGATWTSVQSLENTSYSLVCPDFSWSTSDCSSRHWDRMITLNPTDVAGSGALKPGSYPTYRFLYVGAPFSPGIDLSAVPASDIHNSPMRLPKHHSHDDLYCLQSTRDCTFRIGVFISRPDRPHLLCR
jgi:hypothetical protein